MGGASNGFAGVVGMERCEMVRPRAYGPMAPDVAARSRGTTGGDAPTRARATDVQRAEPPAEGLHFHVARSLEEVLEAWRLVYSACRHADLIEPNRQQVHFSPEAATPRSAVIIGRIRELTVSTLTAVADAELPQEHRDGEGGQTMPPSGGLALDRTFRPELDALRREGRRLMEVGLFADRRRHLSRTTESLLELMRYAFHYGLQQGVSDFVIGVCPGHARFYQRLLGLEPASDARRRGGVRAGAGFEPIMLMRGDLTRRLTHLSPDGCHSASPHPALAHFMRHPVAEGELDGRFRFDPARIDASPVGAYLRETGASGQWSHSTPGQA